MQEGLRGIRETAHLFIRPKVMLESQVAKIYRLNRVDRIPEAILRIARKEGIRTARVEAIGVVSGATLAYFNQKTKKYEEHHYKGELEVASMIGNITLKEGKPFLHMHVALARRDMSVVGGHLISAEPHPFLEVVITETRNVGESCPPSKKVPVSIRSRTKAPRIQTVPT